MPDLDPLWLPEGHHWDLHIQHRPSSNNAGSFTGGGWKFVIHTTEGGSVDSNSDLLVGTNTPHLLFGKEPDRDHYTVIQFLPFNVAGKTLAHPAGTPETNRANAIQVEFVGFTSEIPDWSDVMYQRFANLIELVQHRVEIPTKAPMDFSTQKRFSGQGWVDAAGIVGHMHCPGNDHVDPYRFREGFLIDLLKGMPDGGYDL